MSLKIEGQDFEGPDWHANYFVPSIEVRDDKGNKYCIGLRYNGQSSLEPTSYTYDHANIFSDSHRHGKRIGKNEMMNILEASGLSMDALTRIFVKRIGHPPKRK